MVNLIQIDKSGREIFEKDYSIVVLVNHEDIYGVNIPQKIKDLVLKKYRTNILGNFGISKKKSKMRLRIKFHTTIIILILKEIIKEYNKNLNIQRCNDFDGHFHEIKYMIYSNLSKTLKDLKSEHIVQSKFQKPSVIDNAGKNIRNKNYESRKYHLIKLKKEEVLEIIKK